MGSEPGSGNTGGRTRWLQCVPEHLREHPAFACVEDVPGLPRVLLIGDSISIGYTDPVRRRLAGKANVHRPPCNCAHTGVGMAQLDDWLQPEPWDVIHFNWGLHDIKHVKAGGGLDVSGEQIHSPEPYRDNLNALVPRLQATGARLIWCATTPVPEGAAGRLPEDGAKYNAVALDVMEANGVAVHDLYAAVLPELEKHQMPQNVHFTEEGSEFLGSRVAEAILKALENG